MGVGVYKKKLLKVFFVIALLITVISCFLFSSIFYFLNLDSHKTGIRNIAIAKADSLKLSLDVIKDVHKKTEESENVKQWAYSNLETSDYYFYSVKIYQELTKHSSYVENLDYEVAITKADDKAFVIAQSGTFSKELFIENRLTKEVWATIMALPISSGVVPMYKEDKLTDLVYFSRGVSNLLVITRIPMSSLVKTNDSFAIKVNNEIYGIKEGEDFGVIKDKIIEGSSSISEFSYKKKFVYAINTEIAGLVFIFFYPLMSDNFLALITYSAVLFVLVLTFFFILAFLVSKRLYAPIFKTVKQLDNNASNEDIDEFALLSENLDSLSQLKEKLDQVSSENSSFAVNRYYNELLYTKTPTSKSPLTQTDETSDYSIALVEFILEDLKNEDEYYLQLQRTIVLMQLQKIKAGLSLIYLNLSYSRFALIFKGCDTALVKETLEGLCENEAIDINLSVALSDSRKGVVNICTSFKQVEKIIEYRHIFDSNKVLTQCDVPQNDSNYFYYPIYLENKLVSLVTVGDSEGALKVYDSIIEENFTSIVLTKEAHQNLIYSIIGTLLRIMQELKTTPFELIGRNFDFPWLYSNWANEKIIFRIKNNIEQITQAVSERKKLNRSDEYLLEKMQDYIFKNYSDDIMLIDISEYCNITPKYCSTLFKRLSNENFKTFLNEYRIERASEKIRENPDIKINDLAISVGFNSSNTFIRVFKSFQNVTPKVYAEEIIKLQN